MALLEYLRLKAVAIYVRVIGTWMMSAGLKRDLQLERNTKPTKIKIPSRDRDRSIDCFLYTPISPPEKRKTPVLVNWHGSGFVAPSLGMDHAYCARMAREAGIFVLDADYRKGPETRYPGPLHDVEDALLWVANQPDRFDLSRVAMSGFSAGATLALTASSSLRQTLPKGMEIPIVVSVYPLTDFSNEPAARKVERPITPISALMQGVFTDCYAPDRAMRTDPRVSPGRAESSLFPDTVVIVTASGDILAPEAEDLVARLRDGGRKVVGLRVEDARHAFDKGPEVGSKEWDQREEAYSLIIRTLKESFRY